MVSYGKKETGSSAFRVVNDRGKSGEFVSMIKILFVCHGNICRSAAAEMVLKQMAREQGRRDLLIGSAAATREEIGNDIYPPILGR